LYLFFGGELVKENSNYVVVTIGPECLAVNADCVRDKIYSFFTGKATAICLDFNDTLYMDAAGVGIIAAVVFEGRRKGVNISMRGATGSVLDMLTSTGLYRLSSWSENN